MFILMLSRGIPTAKYPQWGCFEKDQAEALAALGHKVVVASVDSRWLWEIRPIGITSQNSKQVTYFNSFIIPGAVTHVLGHSFALWCKKWQMKRLFKHITKRYGMPDIIYGQFFFNTILGISISQKYKIPIVGIEHAARFNETHIDKYSLSDAAYTYSHINKIIAVSPNLQGSLKRLFNVESVFIPNMAGKEFTFVPSQAHSLTFVAVGTLEYRKGFDLLIKAFTDVHSLPTNWKLLIIGGGVEKAHLEELIRQYGLQEHILLLGQKTKQEILPVLQQADAFILPSRNENFSVAVLEAIACGVPVIASICGGIKECIHTYNGLLFEVDDVHGLAKCLQQIVDDTQLFNHQQIAADYQARFAPEVIAKQLTTIFEDTIANYNKA